jgi:hypothetical protein
LLRSLQEIQPDFEEEAKAYAGLWSQGKKKKNGSDDLANKEVMCWVTSLGPQYVKFETVKFILHAAHKPCDPSELVPKIMSRGVMFDASHICIWYSQNFGQK